MIRLGPVALDRSPEGRGRSEMISGWRSGKVRIGVVAVSTVGLSALAGVYLAQPASAESAAAAAARQQSLAAGTPCTVTAKACVDLDSQKAWLLKDGKIVRGPVPIASGGNGEETPVGHSLRVYRKDKNHKSQESRLPNGQPAPMPYSVFFDDGGIAFHGGSLNRSSAGCVRLDPAGDAEAWFNYLQIGDQVQVVRASQERAARSLNTDNNTNAGDIPGQKTRRDDKGDDTG